MAIRTILRWNDDWRPGLVGYSVSVGGGPATTVASAGFVDAASYADQSAAAAVGYTVTAVIDDAWPIDPFEPTEQATLVLRRLSLDTATADFCLVSGAVWPPGVLGGGRCDVRVEIAAGDRPARYATAGYLGGSSIFKTNCRGEFALPLPRGAAVLLHIPAAEIALRFVVPGTATANLADLAVESYDLHRNN